MATYPNRIHRKGGFRHEEMKANEAGIYPGMLLKMDSSGEVGKHDDKGGALGDEVLIAAEDALQGNTVDTVYADDSIVSIVIPQKGSVVRMRIAENQVISIGEKVCSAGNGYLRSVADIDSPSEVVVVVGVALEAVDLSSGYTTGALCDIRVS